MALLEVWHRGGAGSLTSAPYRVATLASALAMRSTPPRMCPRVRRKHVSVGPGVIDETMTNEFIDNFRRLSILAPSGRRRW